MTKSANIDAIQKHTKKPWKEWVRLLDGIDAKDMAHSDIVGHLVDNVDSGWWRQEIVVAYEQHIGRRRPGQVADGTYETAVSKTFASSKASLMQAWKKLCADDSEIKNLTKEPVRTSQTDKRMNWRMSCSDGSRVLVSAESRKQGKATIVITQSKMKNQKDIAKAKSFWKGKIARLDVEKKR